MNANQQIGHQLPHGPDTRRGANVGVNIAGKQHGGSLANEVVLKVPGYIESHVFFQHTRFFTFCPRIATTMPGIHGNHHSPQPAFFGAAPNTQDERVLLVKQAIAPALRLFQVDVNP